MLATHYPLLAHVAGPLLPLLDDPLVTEIRVTHEGVCHVRSFGAPKVQHGTLPGILDGFLATVAHTVGQVWTTQSPRLHAGLPLVGLRIQAGGPPVSPAPWVVIRKHPAAVVSLHACVQQQLVTCAQAHALVQALVAHQTILIAGAVGSGKTTLLNALVHCLRETPQSLVVVEDDPEVQCLAPDTLRLATSDHPLVTMADLCKDVLRMTPDRLIVGEVRDKAALDMLKAFQCGTAGLATIHAHSPAGALLRLEQCCQEASGHAQRRLIGEAIQRVAYLHRTASAWTLASLWKVEGYQDHTYRLTEWTTV